MYNIQDIRKATPQSGVRYLFDANIWLQIIETSFRTPFYYDYVEFFDKIMTSPKKDDMMIVLPAIVLSEVINRATEKAFDEFLTKKPEIKRKIDYREKSRKQCFKDDYRPTDHYKASYKNIRDSIKEYHDHLELTSDNLNSFTFNELFNKGHLHMEFSDEIIYRIADQCRYTLVTHDGDFTVEYLDILTSNPKLLKLGSTSV